MKHHATLAISSLALVLLVACGSDDASSTDQTNSPTTVVASAPATTTPTTSPATTAPPSEPASTAPATTAPATDAPATTDAPAEEPATTDTSPPSDQLPENPIVVDDMGYGSLEEMAADAELVVYGTVTSEVSLGRPMVDQDPEVDEYLGLTVSVESVLKGESVGEVRLGVDAFVVDADGTRVAVNVMNGIPVPRIGDELLLFLRPLDAQAIDHMGGFPTHGPVSLDGIAFVEDGTVTIVDELSGDAVGLQGKTVDEITALVAAV